VNKVRRRAGICFLLLGLSCLRSGFVEQQGRVWFVQAHRVVAYDADRQELTRLGRDSVLVRPQRIARDEEGNLWISQSTGPLLRVDDDFNVTWSSPPDLVADPFDMVVSGQAVWVSDRYRHTVSRISAQGDEICRAAGGAYWPTDLAPGRDNAVWVREGADWLRTADLFLLGPDCQQLIAPVAIYGVSGLAADGQGGVWVAEGDLKTVLRLSEAGQIIADSRNSGLVLTSPAGLAVDTAGKIWFADNGTSQVNVLEPGDLSLLAQSEAGAHAGIQRIVPADDGAVWLIKDYGTTVAKLRRGAGTIEQMAASTSGLLLAATGLLPLGDGGALVVDNGYDRLLQLAPWGALVKQSDTGFYGFVEDAVADSQGRVWIADRPNGRTSRLDVVGMESVTFRHGSLRRPFRLALASDDSLWAADESSGHLFLLAVDGALTMNINLGGIWAIALHGDGKSLWVALAWPRTVMLVDQRGQGIASVGWPVARGAIKSLVYEKSRDALWVLDQAQHLVLLSTSGVELQAFDGPYSEIAPAEGGGIWIALASSESTPIVRFDDAGQAVAASDFFASGQCVRDLVPSQGGGVWIVDGCKDTIVLLDRDAVEVQRWGGGVLSRPVSVVERTPRVSR